MNKLEILKSDCTISLINKSQINSATYAEVFFSKHCFKYNTQNITEFMNKKLLRSREESIIKLLNNV